jgi:hypothetical protein
MHSAFRPAAENIMYLFTRLFAKIDKLECHSVTVDNACIQNATGCSCVSLPPLCLTLSLTHSLFLTPFMLSPLYIALSFALPHSFSLLSRTPSLLSVGWDPPLSRGVSRRGALQGEELCLRREGLSTRSIGWGQCNGAV